jgi:hypothetical protein
LFGVLLLLKDWYRVCELYTNDGQWALQTKAVLDRLQLVLSERSQYYQKKIQPSAEYLGNLLGVEKWAVCYPTLPTMLNNKTQLNGGFFFMPNLLY